MKRASFLIAALLPFAATANQDMQTANFDYEQLRGNWRVSEIIGSEVQGSDGRTIGEVRDVILSTDGTIASVLVEKDEAAQPAMGGAREERVGLEEEERPSEQRGADDDGISDRVQPMREGVGQDEREGQIAGLGEDAEGGNEDTTERDDANYTATDDFARISPPEEAETQQVGATGEMGGGNLVTVEWQNPSFQPEENVVRLEMDSSQLNQTVSYEDEAEATQPGEIRASELLGMEVNLSDEESFGEVEDLLISQDGEPSALVIGTGNFLGGEQYAVPVELQSVNTEEGMLDYDLSSQEVEGFGEFDLDEYVEET